MSDTSTPMIEAIDLRKSYDGGVIEALAGVTLAIAPQELVAITGPSGCGKSTLLHMLAALDRPDSGTITVDGNDLTELHHPNRYRRNVVGLVFQLHNLLPHLNALENIEVAMMGAGHSRKDQRVRARELLAAVDLDGLEHRRPPQLSGGERQRVAIARALANHPRVLLADEPTGSLDSAAVERTLELLARLRRDENVTIVMVTHDPAVASATDRTIHLRDGLVSS